MRHLLARVGGDLLRVVASGVDDPDAARSCPGSVHRDPAAVGRIGRVEGVANERNLGSPAQVELPDVSFVELAEHVTGLELLIGPLRAHEEDSCAVRRPHGLKFVVRPPRQLLLLPALEVLAEDLARLTHAGHVQDRFAVRRPRRILLDSAREGDLCERRVDG